MSRLTDKQAAEQLAAAENIVLLLHQSPDGDTVGCGYALAHALTALGKRVQVRCSDPIPEKYAYFTAENPFDTPIEPDFLCAVDVADPQLLGSLQPLADRVDLCIDHHAANRAFARACLLDATCGAACMVVRRVIAALGVPLTPLMANALYTGLSTDTGCFKYPNTTPAAHRLAAELMEAGADYAHINEWMFDRKSPSRLELERRALDSIRYACDGRCAFMTITAETMRLSGAAEQDTDGLAALPRQIEGVLVGVTLRQKEAGVFKVSIRTNAQVNAAAIANRLGGGGHAGAAGCTVSGNADEAAATVLAAIQATIPEWNTAE